MDSKTNGSPKVSSDLEEKLRKYEDRIQVNSWDADAWSSIILELQNGDVPINFARNYYERFLSRFPTAGRYWKLYAEHEVKAKNYENAAKIYSRCLFPSWKCPNIELWKSYVTYVRTVKSTNNREEIIKAYEIALDNVGMDINSTHLWSDYIAFLKEQKPSNQYEEGQQITAIRKVYQRAIENPMHNLETIWKEYDQFENELNKILAKALVTEHGPKYMHARTIFRERKRFYEGISRNMLAVPPLLPLDYGTSTFNPSEKESTHQVALWKRLISYEKSNPQHLETQILYNRIVFTYNQCLLCLFHYPEIWFEFAKYEQEKGHLESASQLFDRAIEAIPNCLLIHFAYADMLESTKNFKASKLIYDNLLSRLSISFSSTSSSSTSSSNSNSNSSDSQLESICSLITLSYIQFMKFARRTEGVKGARDVFKQGRETFKKLIPTTSTSTSHYGYQLYVAAAMMEWQLNKDVQVSRSIFDLGLNKYASHVPFVIQYIKFLLHLNEENNIRVVFERAVSQIPKEQAREIWKMYMQFENSYGDLTSVAKMEKRIIGIYPDIDNSASGIISLVNRYKYMDIYPCSIADLDSFSQGNLDLPNSIKSQGSSSNITNASTSSLSDSNSINSGDSLLPGRSNERSKSIYAKPDFNQLMSFKPDLSAPSHPSIPSSMSIASGLSPLVVHIPQSASGGSSSTTISITIAVPDLIAQFVNALPSAATWQGPVGDIDQLLSLISDTPLPNPPPLGATVLPDSPWDASNQPDLLGKKRKDVDEDEDDKTTTSTTPVNTLFLQRQAAKLARKS